MFTPDPIPKLAALACLAALIPAGAALAEVPRQVAPARAVLDTGEPVPVSPLVPEDAAAPASLAEGPAIGVPATEAVIAAIDIDVDPDGHGLPAGSGTYAQGQALFADKCSACHGEKLEGVADLGAPRLIGGRDTLATEKPVKTVESYWPYASTLFDYVHRAMPMDAPGSLSGDEIYAIAAFVLGEAGILGTDVTLDAESYRQISMPNKDGFGPDPRPDVK